MHELLQITLFTLATAAASTVLVAPPAIALGWLLSRGPWPGRSVVETLAALPLVIPPVATGLVLLKLFGRQGPLGSMLGTLFGVEIVFTWKAVVLASAVMAFPLLVRTARTAFEDVAARYENTARTLGAGGWDLFWSVTLPLARRGLLAGALLAFARALGEFGATIMLAGMIPGETVTLALGIYHEIQLGNDSAAMVLLAISALLAFGSVMASDRLLRKALAR